MAMIVISFDGGSRRFRAEIPLTPAVQVSQTTSRLDLLEIFEERYQRKSTLITAQLPVAQWHAMIGEPTIADAILHRIIHNVHRIELTGQIMRKLK